MTLEDTPREAIGLGFVHWPLYYGVGHDWARRRVELVITPGSTRKIDSDTIKQVTAVLRHSDALGVAVGSLPGVRVGVLLCGSGPLVDKSGATDVQGEGMPAVLTIEPSRLRLSVPAMAVDTRSFELLWARLRAALTTGDSGGGDDLGYVDVLEWQHEQFEGSPGRSAVNLQMLNDVSSETLNVDTRVSVKCSGDTVDRLLRAAGLLGADPIDLLDAILLRIVPAFSNGDGPMIARMLNGRTTAPLADVVGRLNVLAPCAHPPAASETVEQAVAASSKRHTEAQQRFSTESLDTVEATCRHLRSRPRRQPLLAVIRGPRLDPIALADGTELCGTVTGDDGDHFDLTVRLTEGLAPMLELETESPNTPIPLDLLEERLRSALDRITDSAVPMKSLIHVGLRESAWLSERLGQATTTPQAWGCHQRILARGERTPDRRALVDAEGTITYGQLRAAALKTAATLRQAGVGREDRVAVVTNDLTEFVTGCLATLAVGAAFVPIDPDAAPTRLAALLERAAVRVGLVGGDGSFAHPGVVAIALPNTRLVAESDQEPTIEPTIPESLAYVLFTSGSTGIPKPVAVEHRALSAYVDAIGEWLGVSSEMTVMSPASFTADFSFTALWPALVSGSTVVHCPSGARLDAEAFADQMAASPVDLLKITPSHLSALLAGSRPEGVLPLRTIVFGGERLDSALVAKVRALRPELRIVNHYGPTETTIGVVTADVTDVLPDADVPLGAPLPHVSLVVCDEAGVPIGMGGVGELVVSGPGIARGYLGDPRATADRFRPSELGGAGARAYRSGDAVLLGGDGLVRFRGRFDDQVKIRGWRVEPAEVEHALRGHPSVAAASVTVRGGDGEFALVAHAVVHDDTSASGLVEFLRERLPECLIPEAVHLIARMPLLPTGKVDRGALRELAETRRTAAVMPRTDVERVVAGIWAELMGIEQVDVLTDVFMIGAHSLMATRALARIRELLQTASMITDIFRHRSVSDFAGHLTAGADGTAVARRAAVVARVWDMTDDEVDLALKEGAR